MQIATIGRFYPSQQLTHATCGMFRNSNQGFMLLLTKTEWLLDLELLVLELTRDIMHRDRVHVPGDQNLMAEHTANRIVYQGNRLFADQEEACGIRLAYMQGFPLRDCLLPSPPERPY